MKTRVLFLVNKTDPEFPDLFAYFPLEHYNSSGRLKTSYSQIGQHSACSPDYAKESRQALPSEYKALKKELQDIGYNL